MRPIWTLFVGVVVAMIAGPSTAQDTVRPEDHPGGVLIVVKDETGLVTPQSPLYLASNWGGWDPADPSARLTARPDGRWQIRLPGPVGGPGLLFKFTRGSWNTVEVDSGLVDIENRALEPVLASSLAERAPCVVELVVARFADEREERRFAGGGSGELRVTGKVRRVWVTGGAGTATDAEREVIVWLPPGYDDPANADRRYPVLYLQDGQNVFDSRPPTPTEWGADETATALIEAGEIEPIIIAAIPNSGENRVREYLVGTALGVEGEGDAYLDWLIREVIPRVEVSARVDTDPERRGIGGSSLGGLLALRAGQRHSDVFGRVLAESPSIQIRGTMMSIGARHPWAPLTYIGFGDSEGVELPTIFKLHSLLRGLAGPDRGDRVALEIGDGAEHNEHAWAHRLPNALRHLYGRGGDSDRDSR